MGRYRMINLPTSMIRKQAGQMRKLLGLWNNSEMNKTGLPSKSNPQPIITDGRPNFLMRREGLTTTHVSRRQMVLNRHFTEIISDELTTNMKKQLSDLGISITSIETKAWNRGVNIFYYTRKPFDKNTHLDLTCLVADLRYALAQLRPMGQVPLINFVYDESAKTDHVLQNALSSIKKIEEKETKDITEATSTDLRFSKPAAINNGQRSNAKKFSSPPDMQNMTLGLDYAALYDEVSAKMDRGRGEASRMISQSTLAGPSRPFIRGPIDNVEDNDTASRVYQMRRFMINQRKKTEYHAKLRRKKELLNRDSVRWEIPEESDEDPVPESFDLREQDIVPDW